MNRVGEKGRGRKRLAGLVSARRARRISRRMRERAQRCARAARWTPCAATFARRSKEQAGTAQWYRRGYFDDGTPLGSASNRECRIDSIAQSWSVISGAADPEPCRTGDGGGGKVSGPARRRIALLFTPPFVARRTIPATSRAIRRASAKMAGNILTARLVDLRIRDAGQGRPGRRAVLDSQSHQPRQHAERGARYKVEPYVACADVYSVAPHVGRGGWTWYTGSAAWLYRAGSRPFSDSVSTEIRWRSIPVCRGVAGYEIVFRHHGTRNSHALRNQGRKSAPRESRRRSCGT